MPAMQSSTAINIRPQGRPDPADAPDGIKCRSLGGSLILGVTSFLPHLFWGLWLGGIMMLFVSVQALFTLRRDIAGEAASALFLVFSRYQLIPGGLSVLCAACCYAMRPSWRTVGAFIAFALACVTAIYLSLSLVPHMEALRNNNLTHTTQFAQSHGMSMSLFVAEACLILVGGLLICPVYSEKRK